MVIKQYLHFIVKCVIIVAQIKMNTKIFYAVVVVIFFTHTAQAQTAGTNLPAYEKIMKTGPEGDTAMYWWNPKGNGGLGHYQLASDSSIAKMNQQVINPTGYREVNGGITKTTIVVINGKPIEFYFDGYWRKYPAKSGELSQ